MNPTPRTARAAVAADAHRAPYLAAGIATLAVFALYVITLSPTTAFWDTSEYIATANMLGIPHPPGNPLFVVFARAWDILLEPFGIATAVRINLFSAMMGALAHGFWFLLADRILSFYSTDRVFRLVGASVAVLVSATAFTVWNQSNVNEKVYTVTLFTIALLSWLAFRWRDHLGEGQDDNLILLMVFILALSVGNHLMAFLAAPALVAFIIVVEPRTFTNWKLYAAALPVVLLGLSIHMYLPIRAALNPVINEADPTCETVTAAVVSVATMGRAGCADLSAALKREQYDKPSMSRDPVVAAQGIDRPRGGRLLVAQYLNYFQYFDWQWARAVDGLRSFFGGMRPLFTLLFAGLGLFGAWSHFQRDRISWIYFALLFVTLSIGLTFYLNFRYGYTYPGVTRDMTEVRERDYFFIVSFSLWGLWAGIGLAALWLRLSERARAVVDDTGTAVSATSWFGARGAPAAGGMDAGVRPALKWAPVLIIALIPLLANWSWANRNYDYTARDWAYNLLMSVEPYGVLFTNGDNDTFPLWYLQEAEGLRRDVTVIVMSYLNTPWYAQQLRDLTTPCPAGVSPAQDHTRIICQRPYEPEKGPDFYRQYVVSGDRPGVTTADGPRGAPRQSILPLTDEQISQVTNTPPMLTRRAEVFTAHNIQTVIPENSVMVPATVFMAQILQAINDRPIYFAMTTQAYEDLFLRPYLIRQGVALKLNNGRVEPDPARGIHAVPESQITSIIGPFIDVPRTEELLTNVFMHRGGFPTEWTHWVDSATDGIPAYYGYSHMGLAFVYESNDQREAADRHMALAEQWLRLANQRYLLGRDQ
ncbi:MAG TPA: DUF2723 domain-containing protein [Longimicrobiales bacterium]|nr:DUF2723 domain-containing protein [Longimicrobiales bacterium]